MNIAVTNKVTGESVSFDGDRLKGSIKAVSRANALVRAETKLRSGNPEGGTFTASLDGDREAIISLLSHAVSGNAPFANWVKIEIDGKDVDSVPVEEILGTQGESVDDLEPPFSDLGDSGKKSAPASIYVYVPQNPTFSLFATKGLLGPSIGDNGNTVIDQIASAAGVIRVSNGFRCGPGSANSGTFTDIRGTTCGPRLRQVMNEVGEMVSDAVEAISETGRDVRDISNGPDSPGRDVTPDIEIPDTPSKLDLEVRISPDDLDFSTEDARQTISGISYDTEEGSPQWILLSRLVDDFGADETLVTREVDSFLASINPDAKPTARKRWIDGRPDDESWDDQVRAVLMPKIDDPQKRQELESLLAELDVLESIGSVVQDSLPKMSMREGGGIVNEPAAISDEEANRKLNAMIAGLSPEVREKIAAHVSEKMTERVAEEWEKEKERRRNMARRNAQDAVAQIEQERFAFGRRFSQSLKTPPQHVPGKATRLRPSVDPSQHLPIDGQIRDVEEITRIANGVRVSGSSLAIDDPETLQEAIDVLNSEELIPIVDRIRNPINENGISVRHLRNEHGFWSHTGLITIDALARKRGYDSPAMKVSSEELDDMIIDGGFMEIGRGGGVVPQQEHLTGDMLLGDGVLGGGYYFATQTFPHEGDERPHYDPVTYAGDSGAIIRGAVNPNARFIGPSRATEAVENYRRVAAGEDIDIADPSDPVYQLASLRMSLMNVARGDGPEARRAQMALRTLDTILSVDNDSGENMHTSAIAAILMGFDGIATGLSDFSMVDNRAILYNRSAAVMQDSLIDPGVYSGIVGRTNLVERYDTRQRQLGNLPINATPAEREAYIERLYEEEIKRIPE